MLATVIVWFVATILVGMAIIKWRNDKAIKADNPTRPVLGPRLSPVARQLKWEYDALPTESRPWDDITSILVALDVKHSDKAAERNNHFNDNWLPLIKHHCGPYKFKWHPHCGYCTHMTARSCEFRDYYALHDEIERVAESVREKERALKMAEIEPDLYQIEELMTSLRNESEINNEFTRRFKELE